MSGSWIDRSATSYAAATAATIGAALASLGKDSHCRGPSTRRVVAPGTEIGGRLVHQVDDQRAGGAAVPVEVGEGAVEDRGAVVDHDHPVAERLDVLEVVRGEHAAWCRGLALSARRNSRSRPLLITSRPMVGSSRNRISGSCSSAATMSPRIRWPEAELADGGVEQLAEVEQLDVLGEVGAVPLGVGAVDLLQHREGVAQGQVPPQRRALAEDDADPAGEVGALPARVQARRH